MRLAQGGVRVADATSEVSNPHHRVSSPGTNPKLSTAHGPSPRASETSHSPSTAHRNSGSTGFSNSEVSRVTIVSPDGVTKYRRLSSTWS